MRTNKLVFDKGNCRVVLEDDSQNAFYTDNFNETDYYCHEDVVTKVVEMYNEGKDLTDIDAYLLDEERCTQEVREQIVEGLYNLYFPADYLEYRKAKFEINETPLTLEHFRELNKLGE